MRAIVSGKPKAERREPHVKVNDEDQITWYTESRAPSAARQESTAGAWRSTPKCLKIDAMFTGALGKRTVRSLPPSSVVTRPGAKML